MNGKVDGRELEGFKSKFGVPGVNEDGGKLIKLCMKKIMCEGNTIFKKKDIHRFTWGSPINDSGSLLNFVIIQECDRDRLFGVNIYRGVEKGISDHYLTETKVEGLVEGEGVMIRGK